MSISFMDSVGHWDTLSQFLQGKGLRTYNSASATLAVVAATSPVGGSVLRISTGASVNGNAMFSLPVNGAPTSIILGFRFKPSAFSQNVVIYIPLISVQGASGGNLVICTGTDRKLYAFRANATYRTWFNWAGGQIVDAFQGEHYVLLGGSSNVCLVLGWQALVFSLQVADSATIQGWVNGSLQLDLVGVDSLLSDAGITELQIGFDSWAANQTCDFCDIWTGTADLGDTRVDSQFPNDEGTDEDWSRSTGDDTHELIDDPAPNDTDYISSTTVGDQSSVKVQVLINAGGTIKAVQVVGYLTKMDAGTCGIKFYCLIDGDRYYSDEKFPPFGSWQYFSYVWDANPAGGAWTESAFNAAEFGIERTS